MNDDDSLSVPRAATVSELLSVVSRESGAGRAVVVATVLARHGSAPGTPGQKLALTADGGSLGTVGGGSLERAVLREMHTAIERARRGEGGPTVETLHLGRGLGMCCGGSVDVLIEPIMAAARVGVVGAGHVAAAVVPLLVGLGFGVSVADVRDAWAVSERFVGATVTVGEPSVLRETVDLRGAVLVMTHDHQRDQSAIEWALREGYALVGGVGSRAKLVKTRARLGAKGFSHEDIARVRMPFGIDVGARTPEEIAVAIAAELVAWRRGHALAPGAVVTVPYVP